MTVRRTAGFSRLLRRVVPVRSSEGPALLWGFAQIFCLIAGHYVLRPVRDSFGSTRGSVDLKYLYLWTFAATAVTAACWSMLVARFPVRKFIAIAYQFFAASFVVFWGLLRLAPDAARELATGYAFFVWYSVYNIFVVSVFWSRAADLFTHDQGKRLFPYMAAGGSLGAICGSSITATLVEGVGTINLLLIPAVLLQAALACSRGLAAAAARAGAAPAVSARPAAAALAVRVRGSVWTGIRAIVASPLVSMIALYVLFATFCGTCVYNMQSDMARAEFPDRDARTGYFATVDLAVNVVAFLCETLLTARLIAWIGVGAALLLLPAVYVLGFSFAGLHPVLASVATLAIVQRAVGYGITSPSREVLFTVVGREEKYKAKNVIDTFVWRGGDVAGVWLIFGLLSFTTGDGAEAAAKTSVIAAAGVPIALLWLLAAWRLRRLHRERSLTVEKAGQVETSAPA